MNFYAKKPPKYVQRRHMPLLHAVVHQNAISNFPYPPAHLPFLLTITLTARHCADVPLAKGRSFLGQISANILFKFVEKTEF